MPNDNMNSREAQTVFLGRDKEQKRFHAALHTVKKELEEKREEDASQEETQESVEKAPFIFLLHGEDGMGKSTLVRRLRDIAQGQEAKGEFKNSFGVLWLDWATPKPLHVPLAAPETILPETVFDYLYCLLKDLSKGYSPDDWNSDANETVNKALSNYEKAEQQREVSAAKVLQVLQREANKAAGKPAGKAGFGARLVEIGFEATTRLIQSGLRRDYPARALLEYDGDYYETGIEGGDEAEAQACEAATALMRGALAPDEFDIHFLPYETLVKHLVAALRSLTTHRPLVLIQDSYEPVDRNDFWMRQIMRQAGARVVWVLSGRPDYSLLRDYGGDYSGDYNRDSVLATRLHDFELERFSARDVDAYFKQHAASRSVTPEAAQSIQHATQGVPLAVAIVAALWAGGAALPDIVNGLEKEKGQGWFSAPMEEWDRIERSEEALHRTKVLRILIERFFKYYFKETPASNQAPGDVAPDVVILYALAALRCPDASLLSAMLLTRAPGLKQHNDSPDAENAYAEDYGGEMAALLADLRRRCPFLFVDELKLHGAVEAFLHDSLRQYEQRSKAPVRALYQRAARHSHAACLALESGLPTLEARLVDKSWQAATLDLVHYSFWLDEREGWLAMLPAFVGALAYNRVFARSLLTVTETVSGKFEEVEGLQLWWMIAESRAEMPWFRSFLNKTLPLWRKDGCRNECLAILALRQAYAAYNKEKYHKALRLCDEAEKNLPETGITLRRQLGELLRDLSSSFLWPETLHDATPSPEAERILAKVVEWRPDDARAWYYLGAALQTADKNVQALAPLQKAIELDPQHVLAYNALGVAYATLRQHRDAITAYQKALEIDPDDGHPYNGLGNVYYRLIQYPQAQAAFEKAIELKPDFAYPYNGLGNVYNDLGQYEKALEAYEKAIELAPDEAYIHSGLGYVYINAGQYQQAQAAFEKATALDPADAYGYIGLGDACDDLEQSQQAIAAYEIALAIDPYDADAYTGLGRVYRKLEQYPQALQAYKKSVELNPDDSGSLAGYARFLLMLGRQKEGKAMLKKAEALAVQTWWAQISIAFSRYAHFSEQESQQAPHALAQLKTLLEAGHRHRGFYCDDNIERARLDGHPNMPLLEALTLVIKDKADLATLHAFAEWQAAK